MAVKVLTKVNGRLILLYRQGKYLNQRLRCMLCITIIQHHFDYASSAWYPNLGKGLRNKLQTAQNKCICYCLYFGNREGIRHKHFKEINWLPITGLTNLLLLALIKGAYKRLSTKIYVRCF